MKTNVLLITACATMLACSNNTIVTNRFELPGTVDNDAFAANVESISVMNLEMFDDWTLANDILLGLSDNYIYVLENSQLRLMCFDRQTGEKLSARTIKGNGPGDLNYLNSMFCIGDTLCVYDVNGIIRQYNQNCSFLGKLHKFNNVNYNDNLLRLDNGNYATISFLNLSNDTSKYSIQLLDKSFNIKSRHFAVQRSQHISHLGSARHYYANGDTIRFFLSCDNHLYTLCDDDEQCIELGLPNPVTPEIANNAVKSNSTRELSKKYDGLFGFLSESGRFILFGYLIDNEVLMTLLDKHTNEVVSTKYVENEEASTSNIVARFFRTPSIFQTDGKFIYAKCGNRFMAELLEGHDNLLDERLKKTQSEYHAYLERNAEYIKVLEPEERDAATVLLKIKLKD